ncbi:MAG: YicC/YloC family endoribonuclease [Gemmatimonadales bacterium]
MTGFGAAEGAVGGGVIRIELKSVNHRYLSMSFKAPGDLVSFEAEVRERLRRDFERGHVTVSVRWLESPSADRAQEADPVRVAAALARLASIADAAGMPRSEISLDLLMRQPDLLASAEETPTLEWAPVEAVLARAVEGLRDTRVREGVALVAELEGRIAALHGHAEAVRRLAPDRLVRERDRLRASVQALLDGRSVDEQRLNQELAFLADRLDITEELVRLDAHVAACRSVLTGPKPPGKQLGFLAQEMGREVNTIGSKANDAAIQHLAVEMKGELERFREQLENLE